MPDFIENMPPMTFNPQDPVATGDAMVAFSAWLAANAASLPNAGSFDPLAGVPHFTRDYSRFFATLGAHLLKYYALHQATINTYLSAGAIAAFNQAIAFIGELLVLDQAGPN